MTVTTFSLTTLKQLKNSVIGNPTAKLLLAQDDAFIRRLVDCINDPLPYLEASQGSADDIRIEAAHVIASVSYGSSDALKSLLSVSAHQALLYAISMFQPTDSAALKSALTRALRAVVAAMAEVVGPEQWGLRTSHSKVREECRVALDYLFEVEALDIYLPLLGNASSQLSGSIAQMLGATVRSDPYRQAISEWMPAAERIKEVKGKRGWERSEHSSFVNCWVVRHLVALLHKKDMKLQEAALYALSAVARNNKYVAGKLCAESSDQRAALPHILSLCKSRNVDLQLAACLCASNVLRAWYPVFLPERTEAMTIIHAINSIMSSATPSSHVRTKACFILYYLVADEKSLCQLAYDRGALEKLAQAVISITPLDPPNAWDEDEPESTSSFREAALTAIAAIALFDNNIRSEITDNLHLIPYIQISLYHRHVGVRYAACQCVRALSRAVAVLRTNVIDSGLGLSVFRMFVRGLGEEKEDRRVMYAVSSVVCNILNEFSPLRTVLLEQGVIPKLSQLLHSEDPGFRMNALWAIKNLLYKSTLDVKRQAVEAIGGWTELASLLNMDSDPGIQEQAYHIVRHIAEGEDGAEMVFEGLGDQALLGYLSNALESVHENVVRQAVCALGNVANSYPHQHLILSCPRILASLRICLVDAKVEVRRPAAACILELVRGNGEDPRPRSCPELHDAGIVSTLRHICDNYGFTGMGGSFGGGGSPITRTGSGFQMGVEDDGEVKEKARQALHWIDHGSDMTMF